MAGVTPASAFAATWRNEKGDVVGTTSAKTMCLWPRLPWRIRFHRDGFEGVVPCRECPGCLELERLRLAERLNKKYGAHREELRKQSRSRPRSNPLTGGCLGTQLFVVRIWAPLDQHAAIAHALHRRRGLELEPGMWRLGAGSFALLSRDKVSPGTVLRSLGLKHRIEPLRLSRGRRAFRVLTAGLLVAREIYGEQRNRFYAKGLPHLERQKWEVKKLGNYQSYDRARSPRAWAGSGLVLVPPEVWKLSRTDRRSLRGQLLRQSDPEGVARIMRMVADVVRNGDCKFRVPGAPKALLSRDAVVRWYREMADRKNAQRTENSDDSSNTPTSEVGGYTSSVHEQGELMPEELARQRRAEWNQARKRKTIKDSMEIIERMKKKAPRGE